MKIIAIIGIRSGSKGIKNKNIKKFIDKPLFLWILQTLKKSKYIERIIISTDSKKYQKLVIKNGYEAPFLRPKKLSLNNSTDFEYINHAVNYLENKEGYYPDIIVRTLVTVPLQKIKDIDKAIKTLLKYKRTISSCTIVKESTIHPLKTYKIKNGFLKTYYDGKNNTEPTPRQIYEKSYIRCNTIVFKRENLDKGYIAGKKNKPIIASNNLLDIDTHEDFLVNEIIKKQENK